MYTINDLINALAELDPELPVYEICADYDIIPLSKYTLVVSEDGLTIDPFPTGELDDGEWYLLAEVE